MSTRTTRIRRLLTGVALCVTAVAISAPAAGAAKFIPGYTDFPNALRVADELRASQGSGYIAGYTDFPNALRVADELRTAAGASRTTAAPTQVKAVSHAFDWADAGIGAGTAVGACLLLLAMTGAVRRRAGHASAH
jgi:hypothetical protein